jgi:hypothetical protein
MWNGLQDEGRDSINCPDIKVTFTKPARNSHSGASSWLRIKTYDAESLQ